VAAAADAPSRPAGGPLGERRKWYITRLFSFGPAAKHGFQMLSGSLRVVIAAVCLATSAAAFAAADPNKVIRTYFPAAETGFDPVRVSDNYSATVNEAIFERLLTYDYLARPAKLAPMVADLPEVSDEGRTYTFHLRKGIYFASDPAFGGKQRELTADDFVYSFKRFFDPVNRSPYAFMLEDIVGLKELGDRAQKTGEFDYQARVPGLEALDRYTLRIKLKESDYNFPFKVAHGSYAAVAREVVEKYGDDINAHPVGTGPYRLKEWTRGAKIILEANPDYRGFTWDFAASEPAWDNALITAMKGKKMPQVGRIEISILEESQSIWLAFENKELDYVNLPADFRDRGLAADGTLLPVFAKQGVKLYNAVDPDLTYTTFNFRDPVVGGFSKEKIALRRAIIMAYDTDTEIRVLRKNLALKDEMPIPPGVVGYEPGYKAVDQYDPLLANKLLDHFGYKVGADGWRTMPDGKPLVLHIATESGLAGRQFNELWQKSLERVKLKVVFDISKFGDNLKAAKACKLMMWGQAWTADIPDGDNFIQLLYGPNTGQSNNGCYESKAFDAFYEKARRLPDSPERRQLYLEMTRQMQVDGAWRIGVSRLRNQLIRPWVQGYKRHPIIHAEWQYLDIDPSAKQ
jgi:ABC-type transport system substrate-binding protein